MSRLPDRGHVEIIVKEVPGAFDVRWERNENGFTFKWHHPDMDKWDRLESFRLFSEIVRQFLKDPHERG